jgi:hypothetical protein
MAGDVHLSLAGSPGPFFREEEMRMLNRLLAGRHFGGLLLAVGLLGAWPAAGRADYIDNAIREEAREVWKVLNTNNYQTVGVLKFRVTRGKQPATLNAGVINGNLAARLENALRLASEADTPEIVEDASRQILLQLGRRGAGLDYFSREKDRQALLDLQLKRGRTTVRFDVLLTGEVILSKDFRTAQVRILMFDRKVPALQEVRKFKVAVDRDLLADSGVNFVVRRSVTRDANQADNEAADNAEKNQANNSNVLKKDDENPFPIELTVLYNGVPTELQSTSDGEIQFRTLDPKKGDKVLFKLRNTNKEQTYGVVLAVDGWNTLFRERVMDKAPYECTKWILDPGEEITVEGFYTKEEGKKNVLPFTVLSDEESEAMPEDFGMRGVYSLHVFAQAPERVLANDGKSESRRISLRSLVHRGLVQASNEGVDGKKLERVEFKADREPMATVQIRYFTGKPE